MAVLRVHRDVYPRTDHGYTWVECLWFERDGERVSPTIPAAGCCERLGGLPGGPIHCNTLEEEKFYAPEGVEKTVKSETVHDDAFYRVGSVCIWQEGS